MALIMIDATSLLRRKVPLTSRQVLSKFLFVAVLLLICFIIIGTSKTIIAAPPNGVDHLRGRWDGVIENLDDTEQPFRLFLNDFAPDPNDSQVTLAAGCLAVGEDGELTPASARAEDLGDGNFNLTVLGTVASGDGEAFVIRLAGLAKTFDPGVADDDIVQGSWTTAEADGNWSATHHDRRRTKCPPVDSIPGLFFRSDVFVGHNYSDDELSDRTTALLGRTNIVSTGMVVKRPDGSTTVAPSVANIFKLPVASELWYLTNDPGDASSGQVYTFTLLDVLGNPIPGATDTDIWTACLQDPPRNVHAVVTSDLDIDLSWDPVPVVPGFDPANRVGSGYQIVISPPPPSPYEEVYGANIVLMANHLIPWEDFGGYAPGIPDGFDLGVGLSELDNGNYQIGVSSYSTPAPGNPGHGIECWVSDSTEILYFAKSDNEISFFNP